MIDEKRIVELKRKLLAIPDCEHGEGCDETTILAAEKSLRGRFPSSYKSFLIHLGWLQIYGEYVYGLGKTVPKFANVVRATLREREELEPKLPPSLIAFCNDGSGNHYCVRGDGKTDSVLFWDHELSEDQIPEEYADSFISWLEQKILEWKVR